jgi:hypothetical protein
VQHGRVFDEDDVKFILRRDYEEYNDGHISSS